MGLTFIFKSKIQTSKPPTSKTLLHPPHPTMETGSGEEPKSKSSQSHGPEDYKARDAALKKTSKATKKRIKEAKKAGVDMNQALHYCPPHYVDHLTSDDDKILFASRLFVIYSDAHNDFYASAGNLQKNNERKLALFFETMEIHENLFFQVFAAPITHVIAERCTGMLGNYATILRQRAEYLRAETVFQLYTKTIDAYEIACVAHHGGVKEHIPFNALSCMEGLRYRYLLIKFNLLQNLGKVQSVPDDEIANDMMIACTYEIKTGRHPSEDKDIWTWMLPMFGAIKGAPNCRVTLPKLKKIKKKKLAKCFRTACAQMGQVQPCVEGGYESNSLYSGIINPLVLLRRCGLCRIQEPFMNDFKKCGGCKETRYCSSKCQKKHWGIHKHMCTKKKEERKSMKEQWPSPSTIE